MFLHYCVLSVFRVLKINNCRSFDRSFDRNLSVVCLLKFGANFDANFDANFGENCILKVDIFANVN